MYYFNWTGEPVKILLVEAIIRYNYQSSDESFLDVERRPKIQQLFNNNADKLMRTSLIKKCLPNAMLSDNRKIFDDFKKRYNNGETIDADYFTKTHEGEEIKGQLVLDLGRNIYFIVSHLFNSSEKELNQFIDKLKSKEEKDILLDVWNQHKGEPIKDITHLIKYLE
jgi:uncharacterized protein (DUF608 family)